MNTWKSRVSGPVLHVYLEDIDKDWEQWVLLRSDVHHDAMGCDRDLEKKHLDKAKSRGAFIADGGDLFDAMQGRNDPRRSRDELREEYKVDSYFDALVLDAAQYYAPYAANFGVFCEGNHEQSVMTHNGTSLTDRLVHMLRVEHGSPAVKGWFGGWIRFHFRIHKTKGFNVDLKYNHHGGSGNAPISRGIMSAQRQNAMYRADIVWNGHNHRNYYTMLKEEGLNQRGSQIMYNTHYIRTPGYNDGYGDGRKGYIVGQGQGAEPLGACWLRFYLESGRNASKICTDVLLDLE